MLRRLSTLEFSREVAAWNQPGFLQPNEVCFDSIDFDVDSIPDEKLKEIIRKVDAKDVSNLENELSCVHDSVALFDSIEKLLPSKTVEDEVVCCDFYLRFGTGREYDLWLHCENGSWNLKRMRQGLLENTVNRQAYKDHGFRVIQEVWIDRAERNGQIFNYGMAIVNMGSSYTVSGPEEYVLIVSDDPIGNVKTGEFRRIAFKLIFRDNAGS